MRSADLDMGTISGTTYIKTILTFLSGTSVSLLMHSAALTILLHNLVKSYTFSQ